MKIGIAYDIKEGPWGGGNQLLKALRNELMRQGTYEEDLDKADVVLFNSFPTGEERRFRQIYKLKKRGKRVLHRVDGPVSKIRNRDFDIDRLIYDFNAMAADGTVFQSDWSKTQNHKLGMSKNESETVIVNAPDPDMFNTSDKPSLAPNGKTRLIATSWSPNPRKGFRFYSYLDEHLDHSRYEMTFVGRSPVTFEKIRTLAPLASADLAAELKRHHIFITASSNDPCSNSLIEALHCGLPAVVLNDGGHPGIVGDGGETFDGTDDVIEAIEKVTRNYPRYQDGIALPDITDVASRYYAFAQTVHASAPKNVGLIVFAGLLCRVYAWKIRYSISFWLGRR